MLGLWLSSFSRLTTTYWYNETRVVWDLFVEAKRHTALRTLASVFLTCNNLTFSGEDLPVSTFESNFIQTRSTILLRSTLLRSTNNISYSLLTYQDLYIEQSFSYIAPWGLHIQAQFSIASQVNCIEISNVWVEQYRRNVWTFIESLILKTVAFRRNFTVL